uniref:VWFD domain-containing protein n=1 Tax=Meloidogyne hapla TaxID=6305 RepID=A0A1I8AYV3_MELHA
MVCSGPPIIVADQYRKVGDVFKDEQKLYQEELAKRAKNSTDYACNHKQYCGCIINGKTPQTFNLPTPDLTNKENYFKLAMLSVCGNEYYDKIKRCAMAHFFNDNKPETMPKDDLDRKILVILDGCATCTKGGTITGLRVTHKEESGGFFSRCSEIMEYEAYRVSGLKITIPASNKVDLQTASFSLPAVLNHRICGKIFTTPPASNKYLDVKLHIEFSLILYYLKDRVAEFRGLWFNLDDGKSKQYERKDITYILNEKFAGNWMEPRVDCWTKNDACKLN